MIRLKRPPAQRKLPPRPGEAAFTAVCNLLIKSTPEENRLTVRRLLRQASRNMERNR